MLFIIILEISFYILMDIPQEVYRTAHLSLGKEYINKELLKFKYQQKLSAGESKWISEADWPNLTSVNMCTNDARQMLLAYEQKVWLIQ